MILNPNSYEKCFYIKRERVWRREGKCIVHIEPLFPGYLFISTKTPNEVFLELKKVPQLTKLLGNEGDFGEEMFLPVAEEERELMENLIHGDSENLVRLSEVNLDESGWIIAVKGPLEKYVDRIVKRKIRLRYVVVRIMLLGVERDVLIGIRLKEDYQYRKTKTERRK